MYSRIKYFVICIFLLLGIFSCHTRKEHIERNGLHSDEKPSEIAKEFASSSKKAKRQYRRQMFKRWKKFNPGKRRRENPYR
jgi:uncharacterized membrane protein